MKKLLRIFVVLVLCYTNLQDGMANATGEGIGKLHPRLNGVSNLFAVPDAPTNLIVTPINTGGMIQFTAPASDGGSAITNYEYSTDNGATWITPSPAVTTSPLIIISGLINCTSYQVKIRAVNAEGSGAASVVATLVPSTSTDFGVNWTSRTSAADNQWLSVTYGNGLFVAVSNLGTGNRVMTSPDGITWTARTSAADNTWTSVTYGNGVFVAVASTGSGNRVMTSPDGVTWTARTSAADNLWQSVTYGNGLFVAVSSTPGASNQVMTSPDGINWTARTSAAVKGWKSITYGNGLFVAVANSGINNRVMTSPDGITWTSRTSAADNSWNSVTYGNGVFVAVASTGASNRVMTSPDGITWTIRTSAADNTWNSVTYGNGLFVAVASTGTGNRVMTSPDGITWTIRTPAADNSWRGVTYVNGVFVAVSSTGTGNRVMTSRYNVVANPPVVDAVVSRNGGNARVFFTASSSEYAPPTTNYEYSTDNGVTFTALSPSSIQSPITFGGLTIGSTYAVRIRAINSVGASCVSSPMSVTIVETVPGIPTNLVATGINTGGMIQFVHPNEGGSSITNYEYSLDNGQSWVTPSPAVTQSPLIISSGLTNCTSYQVKLRAVNSAGNGTASSAVQLIPATSADRGVNWTQRASAADNNWSSVTYGNGVFVAVASTGTGNRVMTSPDGVTWTSRTSAADNNWSSVTYGNGLFVAVSANGTGNRVMTSPDGITWTSRTSAADDNWFGVTYGNGLFVAVGGTTNRVMTSPDGLTWTSRTSSGSDNQWNSITYGNGLFVAVASTGTGNRVMTSTDGTTWTSRTSAADNLWQSVTYGNGLFVAVAQSGTNNRVMTSPDGITWTSRTSAANNSWLSVTYGNRLFVAVAYDGSGNRVMTSPDGITWTIRTSAADNEWNSVTYGNGLFVAVASTGTGNLVMTSGYNVVAEISSITSVAVSLNEAAVSFTQSIGVLAPAITNYRYSIDNGANWTTLSPASTTSPITVSGITDFINQIQLQVINSVGNSCAAIYSVAFNLNKYGQKTSTGSEFVNKNGALGISGIRATGGIRTYPPVLSASTAVTSITTSTASSGGTVAADRGSPVTARGVCWSTTTNPKIANSKTSNGSGMGTFTSAITGLTSGTTYYLRSYATNSVGTSYGPEVSFTTITIL